jgi:hypothetical protein
MLISNYTIYEPFVSTENSPTTNLYLDFTAVRYYFTPITKCFLGDFGLGDQAQLSVINISFFDLYVFAYSIGFVAGVQTAIWILAAGQWQPS